VKTSGIVMPKKWLQLKEKTQWKLIAFLHLAAKRENFINGEGDFEIRGI
jgi:hypothetical protein